MVINALRQIIDQCLCDHNFSTVLESCLLRSLILCDRHNGFRNNRLTSLRVMGFIVNIATESVKKHNSVGLFIDIRKAYGTVDHY